MRIEQETGLHQLHKKKKKQQPAEVTLMDVFYSKLQH